jgi:hypothetical protein
MWELKYCCFLIGHRRVLLRKNTTKFDDTKSSIDTKLLYQNQTESLKENSEYLSGVPMGVEGVEVVEGMEGWRGSPPEIPKF